MSDETKESTSFLSRLGRALARVLRLIFILAVIAMIGAAIYFGIPYLYKKLILPVEENTARLEKIEDEQLSEIKQLDEEISNMRSRMNTLESKQTESAQNLVEMQGEIETLQKDLEDAINAHGKTLKALDKLEDSLDTLFENADAYKDLLVENSSAINDMQRQISFSRSIELLSRAQLYLSQSNYGLAEQDIDNTINLLLALKTEITEENATALENVIEKLKLAEENLPDTPIIAGDSLNIAWQLLVNDMPDLPELPSAEETETPTPEAEATPTESP